VRLKNYEIGYLKLGGPPNNGMHPTANQHESHRELVRGADVSAAGDAGRYVSASRSSADACRLRAVEWPRACAVLPQGGARPPWRFISESDMALDLGRGGGVDALRHNNGMHPTRVSMDAVRQLGCLRS
jgi:hypothetical protein